MRRAFKNAQQARRCPPACTDRQASAVRRRAGTEVTLLFESSQAGSFRNMRRAISVVCATILWIALVLPASAQTQGPTVIITDSGYNPPSLTVGLGQTVTW